MASRCSRLRGADADLPVLVLTARDEPETQVQALDHGANDFMTKPFTFGVPLRGPQSGHGPAKGTTGYS